MRKNINFVYFCNWQEAYPPPSHKPATVQDVGKKPAQTRKILQRVWIIQGWKNRDLLYHWNRLGAVLFDRSRIRQLFIFFLSPFTPSTGNVLYCSYPSCISSVSTLHITMHWTVYIAIHSKKKDLLIMIIRHTVTCYSMLWYANLCPVK